MVGAVPTMASRAASSAIMLGGSGGGAFAAREEVKLDLLTSLVVDTEGVSAEASAVPKEDIEGTCRWKPRA